MVLNKKLDLEGSSIIQFDSMSFEVKCSIKGEYFAGDQLVKFEFRELVKFDTGAHITCFPANILGIEDITEKQFADWLKSSGNTPLIRNGKKSGYLIKVKLHGIDSKSDPINAYLFQIESFTIHASNQNLQLGSIPIFVTFDNRYVSLLIGKDVMRLISFYVDDDLNMLYLKKTTRYINYVNTHKRIDSHFYDRIGLFDYNGVEVSRMDTRAGYLKNLNSF